MELEPPRAVIAQHALISWRGAGTLQASRFSNQ